MTTYRQQFKEPKKPKRQDETKLQVECFLWFWNTYIEERLSFWHVNQKSANSREGNKMKAMGTVKGVWDFHWVTPSGSDVYIEFKSLTGSLSKDQANFKTKVSERKRNSVWSVIRDFSSFKNLVEEQLAQNQYEK